MCLENEPGGHRIQRIPPTERKGRVHTSTVTVAVVDTYVPEIKVDESDLKIEWYSGTGAGGQHRNKKQNSCRLTHVPTGTVVTAQCRSRQTSYSEALEVIKQRVNGNTTETLLNIQSKDRKSQVGSGQRGDKIRTYRFQDNSVQDHITGKRATCDKVLKGYFDLLW